MTTDQRLDSQAPSMVRVDLPQEVALHFRDQLREARAAALRDAEGFQEILFVLERLGSYLWHQNPPKKGKKHPMGLDDYRGHLLSIASPEVHHKYEIIRAGRNDALHQGAVARHFTANLVELALVLEQGLMNGNKQVKHFMVSNPVCAELWQPLSLIRQAMLANSFSYLPIRLTAERWKALPVVNGKRVWPLLSDFALAGYLRADDNKIRERLPEKLEAVVDLSEFDKGKLSLVAATIATQTDDVGGLLRDATNGHPIVVVNSGDPKDDITVVGIVTPFDLL